MAQFLQETIDEHRRSFDPSNLRDLLDTYLFEIQKANEEGTGHNLFEGKDHGMLASRASPRHPNNFQSSSRPPNATNHGRSLLCWHGNDKKLPPMGRSLHASSSGTDESSARRTGPGRRKKEAPQVGGPRVPSSYGIDDPGGAEAVEHRPHGHHARPNKVRLRKSESTRLKMLKPLPRVVDPGHLSELRD